ncbi:mitochondrial carrier protein LEU5 [Ascobolus immersus RN42]|uniref:Mitochondrial thiamine pyrophosphate carrier 1 n=1 Tax=Ascobolus immersus RN42 TaxID=1160509 RepID=A0A3N4ID58_ASCIM|nr:mitochondrial carrier protein LEU5 [Ascobolus immersus RN42]
MAPAAVLTSEGTGELDTATMSSHPSRNSSTTTTLDSKPETQHGKPKGKQSLDYILRSGLAGGIAGCAAKTLIAPLDRVKILFQAHNPTFARYSSQPYGLFHAMRAITASEGVPGLYRGHSATLLRIFPYAAIKFVAYEQIRSILIPDKAHEAGWRRFLSGSLAGVTSVLATYPLEVVRVRLAFETRADRQVGMSKLSGMLWREGIAPGETQTLTKGLANFYRGFLPTVLGMLPYAGVSFWTHDLIGDILRSKRAAPYTVKPGYLDAPERATKEGAGYDQNRKLPLNAWAQLFAGGVAGLTSQTASYPLEVIRRRLQVGGAVGEGRFLTIRDVAKTIWRTQGLRGFYVGLTIGYVKIIPMAAASFYVYERCKLYLGI